jgi:D-3-phosphoglycerate dehydrogenase
VLFGAPNFTATPHLGASTTEAQENVALQVAEQMADYLLTGAVSNALNTPSITAEEAPKVKPFALLAERLGVFAGQILDDDLEAIEIEYEGDVARLNTKPMTAAALAGVLAPMLSGVNMVSAPAVARERGVVVTESRRELSPTFDSLIRLRIKTGGGWRTIAGALIVGAPRIVEVKGMELDAAFQPVMLYINNLDKPGFIGALGTLLGEAKINIATFNLGRVASGEDAIALVGVDQVVPPQVLDKIRDLPQVRFVRVIRT